MVSDNLISYLVLICCLHVFRQLDRAKRGVSVGGLGILAKHRKKQHLLVLLESLRTIKTLVSEASRDVFKSSLGFLICKLKRKK